MKPYITILIVLIFAFCSFGQTGSNSEIAGRLTTPDNERGVSRAIVLLTNPTGDIRYAFTNPFGYFRFKDVPTGITYTISVKHKRYTFEPITIDNLSGNLNLSSSVNNLIAIRK